MIVTEAQATTKWCAPNKATPIASTSTTIDGDTTNDISIINTQDGAPVVGRVLCIASECMLWQWYDAPPGGDPRGYCGFYGSRPQDTGI